jgi:zinc transporter
MADASGPVAVLAAGVLDGKGGWTEATEAERTTGRSERGVLWLHVECDAPDVVAWLFSHSGLSPITVEALVSEDPRPRSVVSESGLMLILRAINTNEGAERDDMIGLRLWFEGDRILTMRRRERRVSAISDMQQRLHAGTGPVNVGDAIHYLVDTLLGRIGVEVGAIEDAIDAIEEDLLTTQSRAIRTRLAELRRTSIALRRYLAPQREVIGRLHAERLDWLTDEARAHLREAADRVTRYVETLDAARERAAVSSEELSNALAEQMNRTMYTLSVVAAIFLPLGLLTGLLGINVGGMPGVDSPWAFTLVTIGLVVLGIVEVLFFRRMQML